MFKYLNKYSLSLIGKKTNNNINSTILKNFLTLNTNALKNYNFSNPTNFHKISNKKIFEKFKKIFSNKKETPEKIEEIKPNKNISPENLKFQDQTGRINITKPTGSDGVFNFSYNTETENFVSEENEIEYITTNPDIRIDDTFSREFLKVEKSDKKITSMEITQDFSGLDNFRAIAKVLDYKLSNVTPNIMVNYNKLDYKNDITPMIREMNDFGFNILLLKSIFCKNFGFFLEKENVQLCKKQVNFLEEKFGFTKKEALDIVGCIPDIIFSNDTHLVNNYNFIRDFSELETDKVNKLIFEYPSILVKTKSESFNRIELYFQIYINYTKKDLQKLIEKNPLLFIIDPDNTLEILKSLKNFNINRDEFCDFIQNDSKLFLFRHSHFKNIFISLKRYDIKSTETFAFIKKYPEMILSNRHSLLNKKLKLLDELVPQKSTVRTLIRMYPFILLKSYNSFVRKILYFNKELEKNILELEIFPIIFVFNFNKDIKPRCELMRKYNKWIPFKSAFSLTPEEFVQKIGVDLKEYESFKEDSSPLYERDLLYRYNKYHGI